MNVSYIRDLLTALGFEPAADAPTRYQKTYPQFPYSLTVDLGGGPNAVDYGTQIERGDLTTSNLGLPENLVVLECVDRLLTKGYHPQDIILEKKYKLGRLLKSGKADIVVRQRGSSRKVLLIIECKTAGTEYEKELANTPQTGGQVFSYFQQDKSAEFLCVYASLLTAENAISYTNAVVDVRDKPEHHEAQKANPDELLTYGKAAAVPELVQVWAQRSGGTPQFADKGVFEAENPAYNPGYEPRRLRELRDFTPQDKESVLKEFAEILRGHNVSDRSNAFNRVVSLILAKIVDEGRPADEFADFQFIVGQDDDERLYERLQTLYTRAMKEYLKEDVINHTQAEVDALVKAFPRQHAQDELRRIMRELKFYSNNEFAFKEVYNEKLFRANAEVLRRMVRLFEPFRFKNNGRAQVLGELFEQLLEGGYKQSEGQFFTPTPIARFLVWCLPLPEIIAGKLAQEQREFLPRVMDYACGAGHFLTETLDRVQDVVNTLVPAEHGPDQATLLTTYQQHPMSWAKEYLYGIEKDYRLARTSQVACFMHGDGDAQIIYGDGLELHPGRLPAQAGAFDAVVANPPYSIAEFQQNLRLGGHQYELMKDLSPTSGNIEVLFIERTAQLLRPGGVAALVLPSSILSNTGLYTRARRFLLEHFRVAGLVEFGGKTFSATSTNTVALLLTRRPPADARNAHYVADDLVRRGVPRPDDSQHGEAHLAAYQQRLGLSAAQYAALLDADLTAHDLPATDPGRQYADWLPQQKAYADLLKKTSYKKADAATQATQHQELSRRLVRQREYERFTAYLLAHDQTVRLVRGGSSNAEQKQFLGYEYTEYYGNSLLIPLRPDAYGNPTTPLCDSLNPDNPDKLNTHLRAALHGAAPAPVPAALEPYLKVAPLLDCLDLDRVGFELMIRLTPRHTEAATAAASLYPSLPFPKTYQDVVGPQTKIPSDQWQASGKIPVVSQERGELVSGYTDEAEPITDVPLVVFGDHSCAFKYVDFVFVRGADGVKLLKPTEDYLPKAYYYLCQTLDIPESGKYSRHTKYLDQLSLPKPPIDVQQAMLDELATVETEGQQIDQQETAIDQQIQTLFATYSASEEVHKIAQLQDARVAADPDRDVDFVGMEHIEKHTGMLVADWQPSAVRSVNNAFQPGDVLYGKMRPNLNKVWQADRPGQCSTELLVLRSATPALLSAALRQPAVVAEATRLAPSSRPRIKPGQVLHLRLALPAEADRPAAELLLADLHRQLLALRTQRQALPGRLRAVVLRHLTAPAAA